MQQSPRFITKAFDPTDEQLQIQTSRAKTVLINANAGAAKTTTLALRIAESLAYGLAPESVLVLVFTTAAQIAMRDALYKIGVNHYKIQQLQIFTFEQFAAKSLEEFEAYSPPKRNHLRELKPNILAAQENLIRNSEGQFPYFETLDTDLAVTQFLAEQLKIKANLSSLKSIDDLTEEDQAYTANVTLSNWLLFQEYEHLRYGISGEVEYRAPFDAVYDLARYLIQEPDLTDQLLAHYRVLICDELHDLNEAAFHIVLKLLSNGKTYFVGAGDKDQVIHATLGANSRFLATGFKDYDPLLKELSLTATFRYGAQLAEAVGNLKQKSSSSKANIQTKIEQLYYHYGDYAECTKRVLEQLNTLNKQESCAILLRDYHQAIHIENALISENKRYQLRAMPSYLQRIEILFLRGMIAIALKNLSTIKFEQVRKSIVEALIIFSEVKFDTEDDIRIYANMDPIEEAQKIIAENPDTLHYLFTGQISRSNIHASKQIVETVRYLENINTDTLASTVLDNIDQQIDLKSLVKRLYIDPYQASVVRRSIEGFLDCAKASKLTLREFSEWLGKIEADPHQISQSSIQLMCVADAKGLEFEHVILPFLEQGQFPDPSSFKDSQLYFQEENLFYVGITRAKKSLTLLSPNTLEHQMPFIKKMKARNI